MKTLKTNIKLLLQRALGYNNYLFLFSLYSIKLKKDSEFKYFVSLIKTGGLILDIGANIGAMSVPLSRVASWIYAFEPIPQNVNALRRVINYYRLRNITLYDNALGNTKGKLTMILPIEDGVKMQGECHEDKDPKEIGERFEVQVNTLDSMDIARKVSAIKLDVENFEYEVLTGGKNLLIRDKPIIYCELWKNDKREQVINFMLGLGYQAMIFNDKNLTLYTNQETTNFFFIP